MEYLTKNHLIPVMVEQVAELLVLMVLICQVDFYMDLAAVKVQVVHPVEAQKIQLPEVKAVHLDKAEMVITILPVEAEAFTVEEQVIKLEPVEVQDILEIHY